MAGGKGRWHTGALGWEVLPQGAGTLGFAPTTEEDKVRAGDATLPAEQVQWSGSPGSVRRSVRGRRLLPAQGLASSPP